MCSELVSVIGYGLVSVYLIFYMFVIKKYKPHPLNFVVATTCTVIFAFGVTCTQWYILWGVVLTVFSWATAFGELCLPIVCDTECLPR